MSLAEPLSKATIHLRDYQRSPWRVERTELEFDLDPSATTVLTRLHVSREAGTPPAALRLDGEGIELLEVHVDGRRLASDEYRSERSALVLPGVEGEALVEIRSRIRPDANTEMQGLYTSGSREQGFLLTQCEAEGFRRISWHLDRPDVLSRYDVLLRADRARFPVLLAGGNAAGTGELPDGRHWARFVDPQPKPTYLFALVAGHLHALETWFTTAEGRAVRIVIWAEVDAIARCAHALDCVVAAFEWDERRFGRSYRLDAFHVVVTHDFTMGAMENTGLNIFNSKYLLADPEHATDDDFRHVLAVVGHEYFHNWTGNRVTCRDWFQLSLKEGLTVYREQEFESDVASRTLRRIEDVRTLWRVQFGEDAGPLAHAVRPDRYDEINNFYTATIYDKGAEIVRMLATLLGREGFRRGMDLYFERHDGGAVTIEDFLAALGDANQRDLGAWMQWYRQAGTPVLEASGDYDEDQRRYSLTLVQRTPPTPGEALKQPVPIPLALALFDRHGTPLVLDGDGGIEQVALLDTRETVLHFDNIASEPVPSLLRGFSAPVRLAAAPGWRDLAVLAAHETDGFNRWLATDSLARRLYAETLARGRPEAAAFAAWTEGLRRAFLEPDLDPATLAEMLTIADEGTLAEPLGEIDPEAVHRAREQLQSILARALERELLERFHALAAAAGEGSAPPSQARRRLRNRCLVLLCAADPRHLELARAHYAQAATLTDRLVALTAIVHGDGPGAQPILDDFEARHRGDALVLDKWLAVQATIPREDVLTRVQALTGHAAFRWENPNKVYALLMTFAQRIPAQFHRVDGGGYRLLGEAITRIDALMPQVAARLATAFGSWRRFEPMRRALMRAELLGLQANRAASADLADIIARSLGGD